MLAHAVAGDLHRLGALYGTDKAETGLTQVYGPIFKARRNTVRSVLEIGIGGYGGGLLSGGSSLRMWRTFFPSADIHGVDLDPRDFASRASPRTPATRPTRISWPACARGTDPSTW